MFTGFTRADSLAALVVAALMFKAGYGLVKESSRSPQGRTGGASTRISSDTAMADRPGVAEVHDLHIWDVTSGECPPCPRTSWSTPPVTVTPPAWPSNSCSAPTTGSTHTTLQVDHQETVGAEHCEDAHGPVHRA